MKTFLCSKRHEYSLFSRWHFKHYLF